MPYPDKDVGLDVRSLNACVWLDGVNVLGTPVKSPYDPLNKLGLFKICCTPLTAFQSLLTWAAGIDGAPVILE